MLPVTALGVRLLGLAPWRAGIVGTEPAGAGRAPEPEDMARARRTARLVDVACRYGGHRASCLPRSLTLRSLLARQGIAGDLRIGVRRREGRLEAHAWVECRGVPLDGAGGPDGFAPFPATPGPAGEGR
jgi:hypothetical protein